MAQFSVTPVPVLASSAAASPAPDRSTPASSTTEKRALNRSASAAVQTVNAAGYAGDGREVTFSVDQATRQPVIKVIDTSTKEVLHQWPLEYLLQLAAETNKLTRHSG
jgi:flagellar protein FlaG